MIQVLDNLISNAVKYCDPAKESPFVKVSTFNDPNRFFIHIEDNGIGIPEARQNEVFGMFKRFRNITVPGSGLGLYLVKKQINKLGAVVTFESSEKGTTFYIEFNTTGANGTPNSP